MNESCRYKFVTLFIVYLIASMNEQSLIKMAHTMNDKEANSCWYIRTE